MKYQNKGNRWYKCDFHLHTKASKCFQDKEVTPDQWVDEAIKKGLHCVAITDHNTAAGISAIQEAAKGKNLTVFPAVEITCDTSKVHLLILFDVDKSHSDVEDFLRACDIKRIDFGNQNTSTEKSIFDVLEIAKKQNGIVIPAHIDEFNGLEKISENNLKKFYERHEINAVHIVHGNFLNAEFSEADLGKYLAEHYKKSINAITIANWKRPVTLAFEYKKALLTFSDNPHEDKNPEHGLWGIGRRYTWIKMAKNPSLESLKQAFLFPESRVRNCFESPDFPYRTPDLWIKSIEVKNTRITDKDNPLVIEFCPQLNTIVGGRGSGKSSILKFIRGVFNRISNLHDLGELENDHKSFYKLHDTKKDKDGVLFKDTVIEIRFVRRDTEYKITALQDTNKQNVKIEFLNGEGDWQENNDNGFIELFEFEHFSQKQIYEIAKKPNALRDIIDNAIGGMNNLKNKKEEIRRKFLEKCARIRTLEQATSDRERLLTRFKDNQNRLNLYNKKYKILKQKQTFSEQEIQINKFKKMILNKKIIMENTLKEFTPPFLIDNKELKFDDVELQSLSNETISKLENIRNQLESLKIQVENIELDYSSEISKSWWNELKIECENKAIQEIGETDFNIQQVDSLFQVTGEISQRLIQIDNIKENLLVEQDEKRQLADEYMNVLKEITKSRQEFVARVLNETNVKIKIVSFRNKVDFEQQLRTILERETSFESDVEHLVSLCFVEGKVENNMEKFRDAISKIQHGETVDKIGGHFKKLISNLNPAQLDEIELLMPEDEIKVEYKPVGSTSFKPLSTASDGQKTTAILTFILSHGDTPLILDQPEDDLDNKLIYELIVERLKKAKESRQLIVVTHNANIPVNADAECVISMNSTSEKIKVFKTGSVDSLDIQEEICTIMEGGKEAFQRRSERYKNLK